MSFDCSVLNSDTFTFSEGADPESLCSPLDLFLNYTELKFKTDSPLSFQF